MFKTEFHFLFTSSALAAITIILRLTHFIFGLVSIEFLFIFFISYILKFNWQVHPPCTIDIPTVLGSDIGILGHLWS